MILSYFSAAICFILCAGQMASIALAWSRCKSVSTYVNPPTAAPGVTLVQTLKGWNLTSEPRCDPVLSLTTRIGARNDANGHLRGLCCCPVYARDRVSALGGMARVPRSFLALIIRDLTAPVLWCAAWAGSGFRWRGSMLSTSLGKAKRELMTKHP
jgi:hypothetical protein